ncbi:pyridoxamine 5'-phosphate oxidase family protein [Noviherbaspirillum sp.]|uniref:pyridoxamine 5'-phosphate oxidase family protein n=1 Tax=Noviherbaspirillum sp. TaxID=1926288 RepID=UPI002B464A28|nr:pyridoxamine 5'-phosphate oxidase family protein [Noviherbaspirillum sp.]HJV81994.1 pyridoxamine 5'-phosphate oxidase family protein [Noviherbaspirillum sp.]
MTTPTMTEAPRLKLERYLQEHHVATLATAAGDAVWAAAVFYVSDGNTFYFLSSPTSRHCENLARNPRVALTVQEDYADWPAIKGVQLEGIASEIVGQEADLARSLYGQKFPVVGKIAQAPEAIVRAMSKVRWYTVVPSKLYFIDNSVGFGHRDEIAL